MKWFSLGLGLGSEQFLSVDPGIELGLTVLGLGLGLGLDPDDKAMSSGRCPPTMALGSTRRSSTNWTRALVRNSFDKGWGQGKEL